MIILVFAVTKSLGLLAKIVPVYTCVLLVSSSYDILTKKESGGTLGFEAQTNVWKMVGRVSPQNDLYVFLSSHLLWNALPIWRVSKCFILKCGTFLNNYFCLCCYISILFLMFLTILLNLFDVSC